MSDYITPDRPSSDPLEPNSIEPGIRRRRADAKGSVVLEVRDLSVDFGVEKKWVPAAVGLNYEVRAGEVLAIVGESGSGKSASSMALLGLLPSNSRVVRQRQARRQGAARVRTPRNIRSVRGKDVAVIFQEPMTALNPVYTVGFQIVETLRLHYDVSPDAGQGACARAAASWSSCPTPRRPSSRTRTSSPAASGSAP